MNTASGTARNEDRWPRFVLAAPRGTRELAWHGALIIAAAAVLGLRGGWYCTIVAVAVSAVVRPSPRQLTTMALLAVSGAAASLVFLTDEPIRELGALLAWSPQVPFTWTTLSVVSSTGITLGCAVVALALAYDRRRVERHLVDQRVWERQQARRLHLLRAWASHRTLPDVTA